MKIKSIKKYEDESRIVNVNFVTSMIENSQVSIGMKYFVVEFYNKQKMGYDVGVALDEKALVSELCDCTYGIREYKFKRLVDDIVKETPKFCYVYDNIWKHVLENKYYFKDSVSDVESELNKDINAYHGCKLYDLLDDKDRKRFEANYPEKERKNGWTGSLCPTEDYDGLYDLLWNWFNALTKGKYELVNNVLYNKAKKAEEKMTTLEYKELSDEDKAEVSKFVESQLGEKGWYHNTGDMDVVTADGRKLRIYDVDTLDLAVSLSEEVNVIGDYIVETFTRSMGAVFKGVNGFNPVHSVNIDTYFREALKMEYFDENRFYERKHPYGRLGYRFGQWESQTLYVTRVNEKSILFVTSNDDDAEEEKRTLISERRDGKQYESFNYFKSLITPRLTNFTPKDLMEDTRMKAKKYYQEAVEKFGKPIPEQEVSEEELVEAASEAL